MSHGKKIFGAIILILAFLVIGGIVGVGIYFATRPKIHFNDVNGGACNNGKVDIDTSPPNKISCHKMGNYNVYPTTVIEDPVMSATDIVIQPTSTYTPSGGSPTNMSGFYCTELCDATSGCESATCVTLGDDTDASKCTCTGYNKIPNTLAPDDSSDCNSSGKCSTVYINNSKI